MNWYFLKTLCIAISLDCHSFILFYEVSCSSSTIIIPSFLKGKSKADLAPINIFMLLLITPFQIILLFFGVILNAKLQVQTKNSSNRDLNSLVKNISVKNKSLIVFLIIFLFFQNKLGFS